jgi:hypothetical protein
MGSSGHAFIAHTKALSPRAQCKDGGYGPPPHPGRARPGQRYWSRRGRRRSVLIVTRVERAQALVVDLARERVPVPVSLSRLLAVRGDGQGRHYQFQGFSPHRYPTIAFVWSRVGSEAILCLPEWHPRRPVRVPARLLPDPGRHEGNWLTLTCDLSASSAGRLQPADFALAAEPDRTYAPPALRLE